MADSEASTQWFVLREDASVVCSKPELGRTPEHARITGVASFFVLVWPMGLPLCYVLVLLSCRASILERRRTPLVVATELLHKEYKSQLFWWEVTRP